MDCCRRCCCLIKSCTRGFSLEKSFCCCEISCCSLPILLKMRKTRLVILPTKCLHQMGFLLLFLSCPVIGDWGRIRPESENSHNAIQIEREGTCGLNRDPPGGFVDFLNENGSKQCRLSEDSDLNTPTTVTYTRRSNERRADSRRINQMERKERNIRMSERRNEREVRRTIQRRMVEERRDARTESVRRNVRSRSVEARRSAPNRNDVRARSLSLSRLETNRKQRSVPEIRIRQENRRSNERLSLARRMNERQNERRADQERRVTREQFNERRETERATSRGMERRTARLQTERRERSLPEQSRRRDTVRLQTERRERSVAEQSRRRDTDVRRQTLERTENRNSQSRRETNERTETRRMNLERRVPEIRKIERRENTARITRDIERDIDTRFVTLSPKLDRRIERFETTKSRRSATIPQNLGYKNKEEDFSEGVTKWMDLNNYEAFKTGDWTTNCVVGAVVYFLTARQQVKTA